jgi:hypothetical protein
MAKRRAADRCRPAASSIRRKDRPNNLSLNENLIFRDLDIILTAL